MTGWWRDIDRGLRGAFLLARREPAAMEAFDLSFHGFYRSFLAALVTAPAYLVQMMAYYGQGAWPVLDTGAGTAPVDGLYLGIGQALSYAAGWITFPIAAIFLTRLTGLTARYVPLVVASNWGGVVQALVMLGTDVLGRVMGGPAGGVLALASLVLVLLYEWHVVRSALETTRLTATGFVLADVLVTVLVSQLLQLALGI